MESSNGLKNERGTIAMARTADPNSATSQFFVNVVNNNLLDYTGVNSPGYAVFGGVTEGMTVIDAIANQVTTTVNGYNDVPVTDVTVITAIQMM